MLKGFLHLIQGIIIGISDIVHRFIIRVVNPPLLPITPIQKTIILISSITNSSIKKSTTIVGKGLDYAIDKFDHDVNIIESSKDKKAMISILNGIVGDYLEKEGNSLCLSMEFIYSGNKLHLNSRSISNLNPKVKNKVLILIHGLCMNDQHWDQKGHNHGIELANSLNMTPIFLNYNTGLHISTNGRRFNELMDEFIKNWPVQIDEIHILAHSMGGLVTRSALHYGEVGNEEWIKKIKKVVFLGTPHHGAPLEKLGNYFESLLKLIHYSAPFSKIGEIRSSGITDLRYGYLVDDDWKHKNRFDLGSDQRNFIQLPNYIAFYTIAATIGNEKLSGHLISKSIGDHLVSVQSAFGEHRDRNKTLNFKDSNKFILQKSTHFDLMHKQEVFNQIKTWMSI